MSKRARFSWLLAITTFWFGATASDVAVAQSAADKATARQLATDGIKLYRQDRFADALDKLERAQTLFDAPVHLLYVARCQAKLNRLVEAAETYRKLIRTELSAQAPQTFKDALSDGQKELPEIEPKIPSLRVEVVPTTVTDLRLTIDGEAVSTAVLGVDRPINPGSHVVEVAAKGQAPISRRVEVAVASKQSVKLELASAPVTGGVTGTSTAAEPTSPSEPEAKPEAAVPGAGAKQGAGAVANPPTPKRPLRLVVGLDIAGVFPVAGKIDSQAGTGSADTRAFTGRFGPGGGLELRAGLAIPIAHFSLTPLLFVAGNSHKPGPFYNSAADQVFSQLNVQDDSVMTAKAMSDSFGLAARFDTAPQAAFQIGGFGELGVEIRHSYYTNATWTATMANGKSKCDLTEQFDGGALRLRGGVLMPVSRLVSLVGSAGVTFGTFGKVGLSKKSCDANQLDNAADQASVPTDKRTVHTVVGLGLGAEFGLGL